VALRSDRPAGTAAPVTFDVWHDEQAGQLRTCLAPRPPAEPPFRGDWLPVADPTPIREPFLGDPTPGVISWAEFQPSDGRDEASGGSYPLQVWTNDSPSRATP
jgi:hypothetical protein